MSSRSIGLNSQNCGIFASGADKFSPSVNRLFLHCLPLCRAFQFPLIHKAAVPEEPGLPAAEAQADRNKGLMALASFGYLPDGPFGVSEAVQSLCKGRS